MEGHPPGGEGRHPPVGGRHSPTLHGGWASMHGGQRPISPQVLTKLSRPPSFCHQCTPAVFLGLINTCGNRNGPGCPLPAGFPSLSRQSIVHKLVSTRAGYGRFLVESYLGKIFTSQVTSKPFEVKRRRREMELKRAAIFIPVWFQCLLSRKRLLVENIY